MCVWVWGLCIHAVMAILCLPREGGGAREERSQIEGEWRSEKVKCGGGGYVELCRLFPTSSLLLIYVLLDTNTQILKIPHRISPIGCTRPMKWIRVHVLCVIVDPVWVRAAQPGLDSGWLEGQRHLFFSQHSFEHNPYHLCHTHSSHTRGVMVHKIHGLLWPLVSGSILGFCTERKTLRHLIFCLSITLNIVKLCTSNTTLYILPGIIDLKFCLNCHYIEFCWKYHWFKAVASWLTPEVIQWFVGSH